MHVIEGKTVIRFHVSLPAWKAEERIFIRAQLLGTLPCREGLIEFHLVVTDDLPHGIVPSEGLSPRHIQITGDGPQATSCPGSLGRIHTLFVQPETPGDHRRLGHGISPRRFNDLLWREPRDLCDPLRGILRHSRFQIIKSHRPIGYKITVKELLFNNYPQPAQHEGHIRARPYGQPHIRFLCLGNPTWVHHDELCAVLFGLEDHGVEKNGVGLGRGMAPQDDALGPHHVAPSEAAVGGVFHGLARAHADIIRPADVGRAKEVMKPALIPVIGPFGAVGKCQGLCAVLLT